MLHPICKKIDFYTNLAYFLIRKIKPIPVGGDMQNIRIIRTIDQLADDNLLNKQQIIDFLYKYLDQYGTSAKAIRESLDYALTDQEQSGGFVIISLISDKIAGIAIMIKSGMGSFMANNFLQFLAVSSKYRNQGIAKRLISESIKITDGNIAILISPDHPAKPIFNKMGFKLRHSELVYER